MKCVLVMVLTLAAGCATSSNSDDWPRSNTAPLVEETVVDRTSDGYSGQYVGRYHCAQGETAMLLTVDAQNGRLEAVFEFGPHAGNPTLPRGSFAMRGEVDDDGVMRLDADESDWIARPQGYITIDLVGRFEDGVVSGEVVNEECSTFSATLD